MGNKKKPRKEKHQKKQQFISLENIDKLKISTVKLGFDVNELFGVKPGNSVHDKFEKDLGSELHKRVWKSFNNGIHLSIPESIKSTCRFCTIKDSELDEDRICKAYLLEGGGNYLFALTEFYKIMDHNAHLFDEPERRKKLCLAFMSCFNFHNGRVFFRLEKLQKEFLNQGLKTISEKLNQSGTFQRMDIINKSLYKLDKSQRYYTIENGKKNKFIEFQLDHFKEEQRFYEKEKEIESLNPNIKQTDFSVLEWVTIFYYANESKVLPQNISLKERQEAFMKTYNIDTTFNSFKNKYYEAVNRLNKKNDYPVNKLQRLIPFLTKNYFLAVAKVQNDIKILLEEQSE